MNLLFRKPRVLEKLFSGLTMLALMVSMVPMPASAQEEMTTLGNPNGSDPKVDVCHWDEGQGGKFKKITVSINSTGLDGGHDNHTNDIIPPTDVNGDPHAFEKNWTPENQAIWENDCKDEGTIIVDKIVVGDETVNDDDFKFFVGEKQVKEGKNEKIKSGTYSVSETPKDGVPTDYTTTFSGACDTNGLITIGVGEEKTCTITNTYTSEEPIEKMVTVSATKIICPDESLLPNDGYTQIDGNTATDFLAQNPSCYLAKDWDFQWALGGVSSGNVPDNDGVLNSNGWQTPVGTVGGVATMQITETELGKNTTISVREVMKPDYLPFSGTGGSDVSAKIYCANDAANYDNLEWIKNVQLDSTYHCVAWNVPLEREGDVTMCKYDEEQNPLMGWTLMLLGEKVDSLEVPAGTDTGDDSVSLTGGISYVAIANGTWDNNRGPLNIVDAEYSTEDNWLTWMDGFTGFPTDILELFIGNETDPESDWGTYNSTHRYAQSFIPDSDGSVNISINDTNYADNTGSLDVDLYTGYAGITGKDGCVTFEDVPFGTYDADEIVLDGWENVSGLGKIDIDKEETRHAIINRDISEIPVATVFAYKLVCLDEADVPNKSDWASLNPIGPNTADDWKQTHPSCSLVPDWDFEWVRDSEQTDPGDMLTGPAGAPWTTFEFGPTDGNGVTSVELTEDDLGGDSKIWLREVLKPEFLPFSHEGAPDNSNDYTAGFYCNNDILNYDNWEWIDNIEMGETYHCVAWNVPTGEMCVDEPNGGWADVVEEYEQGDRKDGNAITDPKRTDPEETLDEADWTTGGSTGFFSLGFGGWIVVAFDSYVPDVEGDDISIHEATNGKYPLESAKIEVSQDGEMWYEVGTADNTAGDRVSYFDFNSTGLSWIKYVKVTDTTDPASHKNDADGFDLDAVDATETVCEQPDDPNLETIELCKQEVTGAPKVGWGMTLSNGKTTYNLVTGEDGCVTQDVDPEDGPWTATEVNEEGWTLHDVDVYGGEYYSGEGEMTLGCTFFDEQLQDAMQINRTIAIAEEEYTCTFTNVSDDDPYGICLTGNLLENGSFEEEEVTNATKWQKFASVTGWVTTKVSDATSAILEHHRGWSGNEAAEGEQYVELDGDQSVRITQNVASLEEGALYQLWWAFAPRQSTGAEQNDLSVLVDGSEIATEGPMAGIGTLDEEDWVRNDYQFLASDSDVDIAFEDAGPSNTYGTFVDDAYLCMVREPVEEGPRISTTSTGGGGSLLGGDPEGDTQGSSDTRESRPTITTTSLELPEGEVQGEQVSVVPAGAPNAGGGGTSSGTLPTVPFLAFLGVLVSVALFRGTVVNV